MTRALVSSADTNRLFTEDTVCAAPATMMNSMTRQPVGLWWAVKSAALCTASNERMTSHTMSANWASHAVSAQVQ